MNRLGSRALTLIALTLVIGACDDDDDPTDPSTSDVVGSYVATEFRGVDGAEEIDVLDDGGSITVTLAPNGTMQASIFAPGTEEGGGDLDVELTGTWELDGSTVTLDHNEDLFLRDIAFHFDEDDLTLRGSCCSSPEIFVTLVAVPNPGFD